MTDFASGYMTWETPHILNSTAVGSRCVTLPAWLPDPLYITSFSGLCQREKFPEGTDAIMVVLIDRRGRYTKSTHYPAGGQDPGSMNELHLNDPTSNEEFARLCLIELGPNHLYRHVRWQHEPPLRYSRSEGDLIMLDLPGIGNAPVTPEVWFCWNITYLHPSSYGGTLPPAKAFTTGTWQNSTATWEDGGGRRISANNSGSNQSKLGYRFTAPVAGEPYGLKFRVRAVPTPANVTFQFYTDNAGVPGTTVGPASVPWFLNYIGDHEPAFPIGWMNGATLAANTPYWIIMSSTNDALVADIDTCLNNNGYVSGRAATVAGMTNNLPNGEDWRIAVSAIV